MAQSAGRTSQVVVLLLLASVGTASAECAWVLWREEHAIGKPPMGTTEWMFFKTMHETRTACEATIPETMDRRVDTYAGGRIWVNSQVGVGSTFTFTLPVHRGE